MRLLFSSVFAAALIVIAGASAQENEMAETPAATVSAAIPPPPPARVGRVSLVAGTVGFRGAGESLWSDAEANDPVASGASLRTGPQARAEIEIGAAALELANGTEVEIAALNDHEIEIAIAHGRIDFELRRIDDGETVEVDIPAGGVWLLAPGRYDIAAGSADQPAQVAVFAGSARFVGGGSDIAIDSGTALRLTGSDPATAATEPATPDEFVEWSRGRAVDDTRLTALYFISADMTGLAELDAAGSWLPSREYGETWVPDALPADWAPYRYGHWRWTAPWGWTWIDDQLWGFAPFHYGRWAVADGHWVWTPGKFAAHPVYAPALVAFLGTPGVGLSFAEGSGPAVAWFPLAPGEVYLPSYTGDLRYIRRMNLPAAADAAEIKVRADGEPPPEIVNGHFANRQSASVVPRPVFVGGHQVAPAILALPPQRLQNAPAIMGSPQIAPPQPRMASAAPPRPSGAPASHSAAPLVRNAGAAKAVHLAAAHSEGRRQASRLHGAHPRAPALAFARAPKLRHMVALRLAHVAHAEVQKRENKR